MKKVIIGSVLAMLAISALVVFLLLPTEDQPAAQAPGYRPDCPAVAGVDLPCLGAQTSLPAADIQIVNVWAWWCEPCRAEIPLLANVARENGWQLVGVHADPNAANGAAFLDDIGSDMPSFQDADGTFAGQLGLPHVVPITVVYQGGVEQGRLVQAFDSEAELASAVRAQLS